MTEKPVNDAKYYDTNGKGKTMRISNKRFTAAFISVMMAVAMFVALPATALAAGPADPDTCYLDSAPGTLLSLNDAFATVTPSGTIVLIENIDTAALLFNTDDLTIDLNGCTLACNTSTGNALQVTGVTLTIDDTAGAGMLVVTSTDNAGVWVDAGGELALIDGEIRVTGNQYGVYAATGGQATVSSVNCTGTGGTTCAVRVFNANTEVTVLGDVVTSSSIGVNASNGSIIIDGSLTLNGAAVYGVSAGGADGTVMIGGNINMNAPSGSGAFASCSVPGEMCSIYIGGSIQGIGITQAGAIAEYNALIVIDGFITPNAPIYINLTHNRYTIDDDVTDDPAYATYVSLMPGYRLYCDAPNGAFIYVRDILTITGPTGMTIVEGYTATSSAVFTLNERFSPTVTLSNDFGGKITWNNTTKRLDIAAGIPAGTYTLTLTASGGQQTVSQDFTLTVNSLPVLIPETGDKLTVPALALAFAMLGITSITQSKKRRTTH